MTLSKTRYLVRYFLSKLLQVMHINKILDSYFENEKEHITKHFSGRLNAAAEFKR
ncbi:MAG: hypothetical protein ACTSPW_19950 [Promethearchaeota archaeon]|mgnify:CR=1 FL=1